MLTAEEAKEIMEQKRSQRLKKKPTMQALKQIEKLILKQQKMENLQRLYILTVLIGIVTKLYLNYKNLIISFDTIIHT